MFFGKMAIFFVGDKEMPFSVDMVKMAKCKDYQDKNKNPYLYFNFFFLTIFNFVLASLHFLVLIVEEEYIVF